MAKKKSENGAPRAPQVSPEEFVTVWQGCATLTEAKEKLGPNCGARASRFRKAGVTRLKEMPGGKRKIDAKALNALIKEA